MMCYFARYPTEFAKTQLQLQQRLPANTTIVKPFTGPIDCLIRISRERGVLAIYQGLSTLVVGTFAKAAIRFYAYAKFANMFRDADGRLTTRATMAGTTLMRCDRH
jgi:solute carrier family 25 citrate transporter 1